MFQILQYILSITILLSLEKNVLSQADHIFKIHSHLERIITTCFKGKNELEKGHDMGKWNKHTKVETVADFTFLGSKITADGDCSHEIKRHLLLDRKAMTNLDSILKSRDITLPTKVCLVKTMVFPVIMYGCESWNIKKAECQRIDAFELWYWRKLLRVLLTARRSNQSILKAMSPENSLEGLMLKLKLQYFGHLMWRTDSFVLF